MAGSERSTPQLEAVFRAVEAARDHPDARRVFERVRRELPRVSLGTVYRNLDKLSRLGRVRVLRLESGVGLYDAVEQRHDHFICDDCGAVIDIDAAEPGAASAVPRLSGFQVRRRSTTFYGSCRDCGQSDAAGTSGRR